MRAADNPPILEAGLKAKAFFTTRGGGVSRPPYDSLNLSRSVGDDPASVDRNRAVVSRWAGAPVAFMSQNHGSAVALVEGPATEPQADAIIASVPGIALGVLVADCVPILLCDIGSGAVGAVHAGRMGMASGVVQAAVERLREVGGGASGSIEAVLGPAICGGCYEVPSQMRAEVARSVPESWAETTWGTPSLDLRAGVEAQLKGVGVERVSVVGGCTFETPTLFSHRRDGRTGRIAGVVVSGL